MDIELNKVLDYILRVNNIPLKALKNTRRSPISLFGKNGFADISFSENDLSVLVYDNVGNELVNLYQDEEMKDILVTVYNNEELSGLSYFRNKSEASFKLSLKNKEVTIKDQEEFSYIV